MKLAVKYDVEVVREEIIRRISADWPQTFYEWERRENEIKELRLSGPYSWREFHHYLLYPEPAAAVRFALEFDCPSILPATYYELARVHGMEEWNPSQESETACTRPARWSLLEASDLRKILAGQKRFIESWQEWMPLIEGKVERSCKNSGGRGQSKCIKTIQNMLAIHQGYRDPLGALRAMHVSPQQAREDWCCPRVPDALNEFLKQTAEEIWDELPELFEHRES